MCDVTDGVTSANWPLEVLLLTYLLVVNLVKCNGCVILLSIEQHTQPVGFLALCQGPLTWCEFSGVPPPQTAGSIPE